MATDINFKDEIAKMEMWTIHHNVGSSITPITDEFSKLNWSFEKCREFWLPQFHEICKKHNYSKGTDNIAMVLLCLEFLHNGHRNKIVGTWGHAVSKALMQEADENELSGGSKKRSPARARDRGYHLRLWNQALRKVNGGRPVRTSDPKYSAVRREFEEMMSR